MMERIKKEKQKRKSPIIETSFLVAGGGPEPSTSGL